MMQWLRSLRWTCGTLFLLGPALPAGGAAFPVVEERIEMNVQSQELSSDAAGRSYWRMLHEPKALVPSRTALIICDMWDRHWSRGATERVAELAPRIDALSAVLREKGAVIVHAPSETMDFYRDHPARLRIAGFSTEPIEKVRRIELPPLPIDDSDGGSDTGEAPWYKAWTRQHPAITIDPERDVISDDGSQIVNYLRSREIELVLFAGVHTNMCVLKSRSFSLKALSELGVEVILLRDLTDAMYNPARAPYVDHDAGTRLVISYIEKFLCPTVSSEYLVRRLRLSRP